MRPVQTANPATDDPRDFVVWERRDLGSEWGPWSAWTRDLLPMIEQGAHDFPHLGWTREP